jgi:hypothetical protein
MRERAKDESPVNFQTPSDPVPATASVASEARSFGFGEQVVDRAMRFAQMNQTRVAWREWAAHLPAPERAVFEAIRVNAEGQGHLPTPTGLSHELRIMLEEGYRVWDGQQAGDAPGSVEG